MGQGTDRLTALEVNAWIKNPSRSPRKLFDGDGLFLTMTPAGTPVWRLRYRLGVKDRVFAIGEHRSIPLAEARRLRDEARGLIAAGKDPTVSRRVDRAEAAASMVVTFEDCAARWLEHRAPGWSVSHSKTVRETLDRHVLPRIGALPIAEITQPIVAEVVERLSDRVDTAQKVRQICAGVFRLAQAQGKFSGDNPADAAREVIPRRRLHGRRAALLSWPELGDLLRRAELSNISAPVRMAHRLCAFTAVRLGNVISADWSEFRLDAAPMAEWVIPRAKMKAQDRHFDHLVVLPEQIASEIRHWHQVNGLPKAGPLFPAISGSRSTITHESVEKVYRVTLGLKNKHTPHGWRSALSTLARDAGFERDAVELALDHIHDTDVARAYDRGERRPERERLARWWGKNLMQAQRGDL